MFTRTSKKHKLSSGLVARRRKHFFVESGFDERKKKLSNIDLTVHLFLDKSLAITKCFCAKMSRIINVSYVVLMQVSIRYDRRTRFLFYHFGYAFIWLYIYIVI